MTFCRLSDFDVRVLIVDVGFALGVDKRERSGIREGRRHDTVLELVDRPIVQRLSRRPFRDRVFATGSKRAYNNTCAISGLRIINGGGRAEAQAAHIQPVHADGPDSLRNGVALSSTFHWMFDRGLGRWRNPAPCRAETDDALSDIAGRTEDHPLLSPGGGAHSREVGVIVP